MPVYAADNDATRAITYFNKEDYKNAEVCFKSLVQKQPNNGRAAYYLGLTYLRENKKDEAEDQFRRIVGEFPGSEESKLSIVNLERMTNSGNTTEPKAGDNSKTAVTTTASPAQKIDEKAERDYADAVAQAQVIRNSAKQRAQFYLDQAHRMAEEMKQVMAGRAFARHAYSQEQIDDATSELRKQAQTITDTGENEAKDLLDRAQLRRDAQTGNRH